MLAAIARRLAPLPAAAKVPEVTAWFWVVKLLTTAGGEATSDWFAVHNVEAGAVFEVVVLAVGLLWQFRTRRYRALSYWFLAYAIAIFGTGVADVLHKVVGIPYIGTTILWAAVLAGVFVTWWRSERTLSIHSITTTRRECFYWTTVFATFALGTAAGDLMAFIVGLGFLGSAVLFAFLIVMPALLWRLGAHAVACFWAAYVLTRPLGASLADWFSKPASLTGLDFGDGPTALVVAAATAACVLYLAVTRPDVQSPGQRPAVAPVWRRPR